MNGNTKSNLYRDHSSFYMEYVKTESDENLNSEATLSQCVLPQESEGGARHFLETAGGYMKHIFQEESSM